MLLFVSSALSKIVTTGFKALQLQYFFTAGKDEVKAWTILVRLKKMLDTVIELSNFFQRGMRGALPSRAQGSELHQRAVHLEKLS